MYAIDKLASPVEFARALAELNIQEELFSHSDRNLQFSSSRPDIASTGVSVAKCESSKNYILGTGSMAGAPRSSNSGTGPDNTLALRQGNSGCAHLTFRMAVNQRNNGLSWVAVRNSGLS